MLTDPCGWHRTVNDPEGVTLFRTKIRRALGVAFAGVTLAAALVPLSASAAPDSDNPQAPKAGAAAAAAAAAPDSCLYLSQPSQHNYRAVNNVPYTYTVGTYGGSWFNVACGSLSFSLLPGQEALVDLKAVGELDCQGPADGNAWCGGRFLINGLPLARPDNSNRGDTFAWDSANGGSYDWQANTIYMIHRAICDRTTNPNGCNYRIQLQSRLENGATGIWIDDLTVAATVSVGAITVVSGVTTP